MPGGRWPATHGARSVLRRLRDNDLDWRMGPGRQMRELAKALARDLGASRPEDLPAQQQILLRRVAAKEVVCRLLESYALAEGPIGKDGRLVHALGEHYLGFANSVRLDLVALGLERKAKDVVDLERYVEARYGGRNGPKDASE